MAHIIIIGAGVIGLQTAVTLLEAGYKVTIIAKHFPKDESIEYTSPWAGAVWRTHANPDQTEQCQWDIESYRSWMEVLDTDPNKAVKMGIERRTMHIYCLSPKITTSSPSVWYSSYVKNFRILGPEELPHGCRSGSSCDSIAINPPVYLFFLLSYATQLGARYIRAELSHDRGFARVIETALNISSEAPESPPGSPFDGEHNAVVINCTGLGARALCQDDAMYPIRGQTLLVRIEPQPDMPPAKIIMHPAAAPAEGGVTYIVPRPRTDRFILGGTKKDNDWSPNPDPKVTNGIIDRCRLAWPALKRAEIEVLSTQVGLRPGRRGGARVEREEIELSKGKTVFVIHQYGHAGAGYQNSIGSAKKVLGLVKEVLR